MKPQQGWAVRQNTAQHILDLLAGLMHLRLHDECGRTAEMCEYCTIVDSHNNAILEAKAKIAAEFNVEPNQTNG